MMVRRGRMERVEKRENGVGGEEGEWRGWRRGRMEMVEKRKNEYRVEKRKNG